MRTRRNRNRRGQSIVETMVGLVALVVLIAGLLQVASLAEKHTQAMNAARKEAAQLAMTDLTLFFTPDFIKDWQEGGDTKRYTKDDTSTAGDLYAFENVIVSKAADAAGWTLIDSIPGNDISAIHSGIPQAALGLVNGHEEAEVDLLPAFQSLIYDAPSITVEGDVWLTQTGGFY